MPGLLLIWIFQSVRISLNIQTRNTIDINRAHLTNIG